MTQSPAEIWKAFGDRLQRYIRKRVRHEHDAADVLQDVFLKMQSHLSHVAVEERLEAWLFQVTRRAIIDHFRRHRTVEPFIEHAEAAPPENVSAEVASWLTPMMELLDQSDREALRLTDLEGLTQKELASRLGLSLTGAKSRVQRARARLKEVLLDCCEIEMDRRGNALSYSCRDCACRDDGIGR